MEDTKKDTNEYVRVVWTAYDVQTLRPNWCIEKCEAWLVENEKYIQDRLVEVGWEVLQDLLDFDGGN